jgi:hypothetical protein
VDLFSWQVPPHEIANGTPSTLLAQQALCTSCLVRSIGLSFFCVVLLGNPDTPLSVVQEWERLFRLYVHEWITVQCELDRFSLKLDGLDMYHLMQCATKFVALLPPSVDTRTTKPASWFACKIKEADVILDPLLYENQSHNPIKHSLMFDNCLDRTTNLHHASRWTMSRGQVLHRNGF